MGLLRSELHKLRRPLTIWTAVIVILIVGLFAWGSQKAASQQLRNRAGQSFGGPTSCADIGMQPGPKCDQQLAQITQENERSYRQYLLQVRADAARAKQLRGPLGAGAMAAGMMASMVGAVAMMLLTAGHLGNEWSGKTIKQVLAQEGRRWRFLAAKVVSLFVAGIALLLAVWVALALLSFVFDAAYPFPSGVPSSTGQALHQSLTTSGRALVVIATFAALGALCAVITRNTLGSFFLGFAFVIASLILAGFRAVTHLTLAYWVTGWMRFNGIDGALVTHLWRDDFYPVAFPTPTFGLVGLVAFGALCWGAATLRLQYSDIKN